LADKMISLRNKKAAKEMALGKIITLILIILVIILVAFALFRGGWIDFFKNMNPFTPAGQTPGTPGAGTGGTGNPQGGNAEYTFTEADYSVAILMTYTKGTNDYFWFKWDGNLNLPIVKFGLNHASHELAQGDPSGVSTWYTNPNVDDAFRYGDQFRWISLTHTEPATMYVSEKADVIRILYRSKTEEQMIENIIAVNNADNNWDVSIQVIRDDYLGREPARCMFEGNTVPTKEQLTQCIDFVEKNCKYILCIPETYTKCTDAMSKPECNY